MNVLFDFGNVLYTFDYGVFFRAMAPQSRKSEEELRQLLFDGSPSAACRFETGRIDPGEFINWYKAEAGIDLPETVIRQSFLEIFSPHEPGLLVARECAAVTRIGLVSNTNRIHFEEYMRHVPDFDLFSVVVLSYSLGAMKPDERLFQCAVNELNCEPEDCIFIDDLAENVSGAESFGMTGIHYLPGTDLRREVMCRLNP